MKFLQLTRAMLKFLSMQLLFLTHEKIITTNALFLSDRIFSITSTPRCSAIFASSPKVEKESIKSTSSSLTEALILQQQAERLRAEAEQQALELLKAKEDKIEKENDKTDQWIDELLIQYTVDENTQMLNSVDQVMERLQSDRYSKEQVNKIFKRICETGPPQSRSKCSPLMSLFVDAVGKLDEVERNDNPNKRWTGRVERVLRKKLFAMDWGIELEDEDDDENPWKLR
jgi:hypothetical protein